jgi:Response regulator containing a CheY-like receiver domain and an HTH DNA-binding domain
MQKELLEECLAEGMSLEAIGKRVGKHESTVSYWLKKHGLEAARADKHSAKGMPSKEEMERLLAAGLSLREIAERMDRSLSTIRHWMRKYQLETDRAARLRESKDACRSGSKMAKLKCPKHGTSTFVARADGRFRLDPKTKQFQITSHTRSLARLRAEASKCVLLCSNCHAEVEAGITAVPLNSLADANPE